MSPPQSTESQPTEALPWRHRPFPELVRLAWPIVTSLLSYSAMTLVDALFVGRLGPYAIAATGLGSTTVFGVLCFGLGLFAGAKVRVSRAVGAGELDRLSTYLGAFLRLALILGTVGAALGIAAASALPYVSSDGTAGEWSKSYCQIRSMGMPLVLVTAAIAQYRQARGESRAAMRAALIANVLHVPINALFIFAFGWGVAGAAFASVVCAGVEAFLLAKIQASDGFGWDVSSLTEAWAIFRFGLPTAIERWLDCAAFVALVALLARMGPVQLAAHQIVLQVIHFCFLPMIALSDAVCVLVAQANGARESQAGRRVVRYALASSITFGVVCGIVLLALGGQLVGLFTTDPVTTHAASQVLRTALVFQFVNTVFMVFKGALRGSGHLRFVAWVCVICAWVWTPPLTWYLGYHRGFGAVGGWLGLTIEILVATGVLGVRLWQVFSEAGRVDLDASPSPALVNAT